MEINEKLHQRDKNIVVTRKLSDIYDKTEFQNHGGIISIENKYKNDKIITYYFDTFGEFKPKICQFLNININTSLLKWPDLYSDLKGYNRFKVATLPFAPNVLIDEDNKYYGVDIEINQFISSMQNYRY